MKTETVDIIMDGLSVLNLLILLLGLIKSIKTWRYAIVYFGAIMSFELLSLFVLKNNLFLFSLSYYTHLVGVSFFVFVLLMKWRKRVVLAFLLPMIVPMVLSLLVFETATMYESYDWQLYNFCIILLCMFALLQFIQSKIRLSKTEITLLLVGLFYFTLDLVLALSVNYLVNQPLEVVQGVWIFRAFCLTVWYSSLLRFVWKHKPIP